MGTVLSTSGNIRAAKCRNRRLPQIDGGSVRASSGDCYEPGEFCPHTDAGMTGVAGDGKTIICENNNGLRWEPT